MNLSFTLFEAKGIYSSIYNVIFLFFLLVQKETKKAPENDNSPFSGWFPDYAALLP
jgi:hypothetical protein